MTFVLFAFTFMFIVLIVLIDMFITHLKRYLAARRFEQFLKNTWAAEWKEGEHGSDN